MKAQAKSSLIILMTLLIGIVLGGLISGAMKGRPSGRPPMGQGKGRLEMMLNRVVEPNETQAAEFNQIIESYSPKFMEQHQQHTVEMKVLMDSLVDDLTPILTEEQLVNLKKRMERMSRGFRGHGKRGRRPNEAGQLVEPEQPVDNNDN